MRVDVHGLASNSGTRLGVVCSTEHDGFCRGMCSRFCQTDPMALEPAIEQDGGVPTTCVWESAPWLVEGDDECSDSNGELGRTFAVLSRYDSCCCALAYASWRCMVIFAIERGAFCAMKIWLIQPIFGGGFCNESTTTFSHSAEESVCLRLFVSIEF